jgi:alpha-beta hydrolase superfamily lysophospholipase
VPEATRLLRLLVPAVAMAIVAVVLHRVEPPGPGSFYDAPSPLPPGPPGTIIRTEAVTPAPAGAAAWRILYVSSDRRGDAIAVSGTVFAPDGPAPGGGRPVVAWAHPTTGVAARCAPSLEPGAGADAVPGLDAMLAAGWVVTATDYPGLGTAGPHPYLVGDSEGRAVLDSLRAARALPDAGAGPDTPAAVWGHSQGGHAALFAGQLAPTYAADQHLAGVATAAPATDLTALLQHDIGGTAGNVLASMAMVSWSDVYAGEGVRLDQVVEPLAEPVARRVAERCIESRAQLAVDLPDAEVLRLRFTPAPPWNVAGWDTLLTDNTPGTEPVTVPVLVNQGTADTVVWHDVTAAWVQARCAAGATVARRDYDGATHLDIATRSAPDAVAWIADRLAGRPVATPCGANAGG